MPPAPPPEDVLPGSASGPRGPGRRSRKASRWSVTVTVLALFAAAVVLAGSFVELPYYTISPGDALELNERIEIDGAQTHQPDGELLMLFVRQRANVNVWRWLQASLDSDIDLFREEEVTGGRSPSELQVESDAQMTASQTAAKRVALEAAGFEVPVGAGLEVLAVVPSRPADGVLESGDIVTAVEGRPLEDASELGERVRAVPVGSELTVEYRRDGRSRTATLETEAGDDGEPIIGVYVAGSYDFPVDIDIDTASIGGPSAGLAMTLTILDELTEGELTGGRAVAITGTIAEDGAVGEIGGLGQKAVTARHAGAEVFIVPACTSEAVRQQCESDLERARERAGDDVEVFAVATLDEALEALATAGGDPVQRASAAD